MSLQADSAPRPRALAELTAGLATVPAGIMVSDVTADSRAVTPGALFLACRGRTHHGLRFAAEALTRGARAVLYESEGAESDAQAPRSADAFVGGVAKLSAHAGTIADRFFGAPSAQLTVAGITGTNGKTTCAWLLAQALEAVGRPAAYMGTLGFGRPPQLTPTVHTTADAVNVQRQLAALRALGAECVGMEVSSHALDQFRVEAVRFNTAAFTNLTRDHLDYHGTMAAYGAAKARLFAFPGLVQRVINIDDPFGAALASRASPARLTVTTRNPSFTPDAGERQYLRAVRVRPDASGLAIAIESSWGPAELALRLMGEFNVDNALTVLAVLLAWGVPLSSAAQALGRCRAASGRMEMLGGGAGAPLATVDYAHTPDALEQALRAARLHCRGLLRVVFGCGGDRDPGKRPLMGSIAGALADDLIVTDDNPRTEDPAGIVAQIVAGAGQRAPLVIEHDRERAIRLALARSAAADVVLIAGKGHEDYQIIGSVRRPFSDQAVVMDALRKVGA